VTAKKRLITRLALWTAGVLFLALLTGGAALVRESSDRRGYEANRRRERDQAVERSRQYLSELTQRIEKLPVDPTLVGEVESRYFDEQATGPMQVWAMGTDGEFLFGVPRESFRKLNAIYDREITPRLKEGVFLDRQAFLLGHLGDAPDLVLSEEEVLNAEASADLWRGLRWSSGSDGVFIVSAPLKTPDGVALGSVYLRREPGAGDHYLMDDRLEVAAGVSGAVAVLAFIFLWILLPTWVYVDGRERGVRRIPLFAFLTVLSSLIGLVVYLISRPDEGKALTCPGCGREVNGGAFCPHCGRDLSASFCGICRYPLKPDWAFCPSCRTEIRGVPPPTASTLPSEE
jgi:hypothetical protein